MRKATDDIQRARLAGPAGGDPKWGVTGRFSFLHPETGRRLNVIATDGEYDPTGPFPKDDPIHRWEHVSVSLDRALSMAMCPTWAEMCFIKAIFWDEEEMVVQYHPARSEYVNNHPGVLHLYRYKGEMPKPPKVTV
jgi:hypothetical protein